MTKPRSVIQIRLKPDKKEAIETICRKRHVTPSKLLKDYIDGLIVADLKLRGYLYGKEYGRR